MGIGRLFRQSVILETLLGAGPYGAQFASPVTITCATAPQTKLVRNAAGEEVVSSTTVYAAISTAPDEPAIAGQFAPGSRVQVDGKVAHVVSTTKRGLPAPASAHHVEVYLA